MAVESASSSVTRIVARKACGQSARVASVSRVRRRANTAPVGSRPTSPTSHRAVLRNPCPGSGPSAANCGKMTGMPPRIVCSGEKRLFALTKSISSPEARFHDVTCAPWIAISALEPEACRSGIVSRSPMRPRMLAGEGGSLTGAGAGSTEGDDFVHAARPPTPTARPAPASRLMKRRRSESNSKSVMRCDCWSRSMGSC